MAPLKRPNIDSPSSSAAASDAGKRVKFAATAASAAGSSRSGTRPGADEDELSDLETGSGRKNNVIDAGYESDSSAGSDDEGGFGGAGGGRQGRGRAKGDAVAEDDGGEDDDDMFGASEAKDEEKGKGKKKDYLELGDIEGQEFRDPQGDIEPDEEEYLPEDDLANGDDAPRGKRSKEGMGYTLSSFNMADELSEGRFDADGTYVRNAGDKLAVHDSWLDGVSKKSIREAKLAKERMEADARRREEEDARKGSEQLAQERDDCLIGLLSLVREGETVAQALARLGKKRAQGPKREKRIIQGPSRAEADGEETPMQLDEGTPAEQAAAAKEKGKARQLDDDQDPLSKKINLLTHLASTLLSTHGDLEIYSQSYGDIIHTLKAEGAVRRDWVPPVDPDIETERQEQEAKVAKELHEAAATSHARPLIARPSGAVPTRELTEAEKALKFSYKWLAPPKGEEGKVYGPYARSELDEWIKGGYFGPEGVAIEVKREGEEAWLSWKDATAA